MIRYCLKKVIQVMIVMFVISFLAFGIIYLAPGDVSAMYIRPDMTEQQKEEIRERLGVNDSMTAQYIRWGSKAIKGDFGNSFANKKPVLPQFTKRLPATMLLMGSSLVLSVFLAIVLGLIAGLRKNQWLDKLISALAYIGMSVPSFWLGILLIIFFATMLHVLPIGGMHTTGVNTLPDTLKHMIMPCITLCLGNMASFIRYVRSNTIREMNEEYVLTAKSKGSTEYAILWKHILKNTLLPVITLVGMNLATIVCGSFIVETIFGWPGVGTYVMSAIIARDYPVIMFFILFSGLILVIGNFIADVIYGLVDPRIRKGGSKPW